MRYFSKSFQSYGYYCFWERSLGIIGGSCYCIHDLSQNKIKQKKRLKLRKAFLAELQSTNHLSAAHDMLGSDPGQYFYIYHDFIPTSTYDHNLDDIGILTDEEIECIVLYYSEALIAKQERKATQMVVDADRDFSEQSSAITSLRESVEILEDLKSAAITTIEEKLGDELNKRNKTNDKQLDEINGYARRIERRGASITDAISSRWNSLRSKLEPSTRTTIQTITYRLLVFIVAVSFVCYLITDEQSFALVSIISLIIFVNYSLWQDNDRRKEPIKSTSWRTIFLSNSILLMVVIVVISQTESPIMESSSIVLGGFAFYLVSKDTTELLLSEITTSLKRGQKNGSSLSVTCLVY